jgi:zinc protease
MLATVARAFDGGITAADVARAQSVSEAGHLRGLETMEGQASFIAEWEALGDWQLGVEYMKRIMSITRDEVRAAAAQYLAPDSAAVLTYGPQ